MSSKDLLPDAVLGRPTKRDDEGWALEATCYSCGRRIGSVAYVTEADGQSYYTETELVPGLVERRGLDPETGWPRFAPSAEARGRKPGRTGAPTSEPTASASAPTSVAAGPVIVTCPNQGCGKRQGIVPELQWSPSPDGGVVTAGSASWGGSKLAAWYDAQRKANAAIREKRPRARMNAADAAAHADRTRARRLKRRDDLLRQREKLLLEVIEDPDGSGAYPAARIQLRLVDQWLTELEADLGTIDDA